MQAFTSDSEPPRPSGERLAFTADAPDTQRSLRRVRTFLVRFLCFMQVAVLGAGVVAYMLYINPLLGGQRSAVGVIALLFLLYASSSIFTHLFILQYLKER